LNEQPLHERPRLVEARAEKSGGEPSEVLEPTSYQKKQFFRDML
jgi:hypothetical protein